MIEKRFEIVLKYPFLYNWKQDGNISWISNSSPAKEVAALRITNNADVASELKNLNCHFALVMQTDQFVLAAVDRTRTFPLFYKTTQEKIIITDDINQVETTFTFDKESVGSFKKHLCCYGNQTLLTNWNQLNAGQYLFFDKETQELNIARYSSFTPVQPLKSLDVTMMKETYLATFQGILDTIKGQPIILSLSGGYDSRTILSVLHELGALPVIAYTYGVKNSFEKEIAEKIASRFHLNWRFIEYDHKLLDEFFSNSWKGYVEKNHHFTSLPNEQDFFALQWLHRNSLLPEGGVVFSGNLGDCLGGSMFKNRYIKKDRLQYQDDFLSNFESKYTLNGLRVYEYFGLGWQAPMVMPAILDAWFSISLQERCYKNGFNEFLRNTFFKPLGIDFLKRDHFYRSGFLKNFLKETLPNPIVQYIKGKRKIKNVDDPFDTAYLYSQLTSKLSGYTGGAQTFNELHALYFLKNLRGALNDVSDK